MGRLRRSMLYLPGNNPRFLAKALAGEASCIILDLEDAVAPQQKGATRQAVVDTLRSVDFGAKEKVVRVNSLRSAFGLEDVKAVVPARPHTLIVPKFANAQDVLEMDALVTQVEKDSGLPEGEVKLMPLIESPSGVINVESIATASRRITGLAFGVGDYTESMRGKIYYGPMVDEQWEILYPRTKMLLACRAAGVDAIDTPHPKVGDLEGLERSALRARTLGYDGKALIHPSHVTITNRIFSPSPEDIAYAQRVISTVANAEAAGIGAASMDGHLVENVHVAIAERILSEARQLALI